MPRVIKNKLVADWTKMWRSYSVLAHIFNLLIALSFAGMSALPVLSDYISPHTLFISVGVFSVLGVVGRVLKQTGIDDPK